MNIVLCGFMGSGKSTVGRKAAKLSGYTFVDVDKVIEQRCKMPVAEIFAKLGENEFRRLETEAAVFISQSDNQIIATGGGTVLNPENVRAFHRGKGKIVFLDVPVAALQERLKRDKRRPLLQRPNRREFIEELHAQRYPKYKAAADIVLKAGAPLIVVARELVKIIEKLRETGGN